jgi:hypothetical protein
MFAAVEGGYVFKIYKGMKRRPVQHYELLNRKADGCKDT